MKFVLRNIFIAIFFGLFSIVSAEDITINNKLSDISSKIYNNSSNTNEISSRDTFILSCKKDKNSANCSKTSVNTEKIINQNDALFLGRRLYMDNYNPLFFNQNPEYINSALYVDNYRY